MSTFLNRSGVEQVAACMALIMPCSVTLCQKSVAWQFTRQRSSCPWLSWRRACGADCWRRNIRCPTIHLSSALVPAFCSSVLLAFCSPSLVPSFCAYILASVHRSVVYICLSFLFWFVFVLFFNVGFLYFDLFNYPFVSTTHHSSIHSSIFVFLLFILSSIDSSTYAVQSVIHESIQFSIHCCLWICPIFYSLLLMNMSVFLFFMLGNSFGNGHFMFWVFGIIFIAYWLRSVLVSVECLQRRWCSGIMSPLLCTLLNH